jgi:DNA polymerase I-like protein with 3'-5' exonuclease and polymerase domains
MGLRSVQVIHQHDEFQRDTHPDDAYMVGELAKKAFKEAGEYFKLNVPLVGDVKYGVNWRDTH